MKLHSAVIALLLLMLALAPERHEAVGGHACGDALAQQSLGIGHGFSFDRHEHAAGVTPA